MGKKLKDGFKKTAANLDTGARTIANGPLFIIEKICEIIMMFLYIFRIWVIFPIVMIFSFLLVYADPKGGGRTRFELSDFLSYCRFLFMDQVSRGQLFKTIVLGVFVAIIIYVAIYVIRVKVVGSLYEWARYHRDQNDWKIEHNNDRIKVIDTNAKYGSKREQLKDELKDFRNSDDFKKR